MFKKVIKNTSLISLGTLISRFLGFIRDVLIANFFGTSVILEAFLVAFRLPNLFRSIFAEGFTEAVATPVLSEYQNDKPRLLEISNRLLCLFSVILPVATTLGIIFSKTLVMLIAPGFIADAYKFELAVSFTRLTFFYLFLIGLSSNMTSALYALKKFFIPALNPIFLNITFIIGVPFFIHSFRTYILVVCVLMAGFLELAFPMLALKKEGMKLRFSRSTFSRGLKDEAIVRMFKLFGPRVYSSIIYHLNVFVDTIFSSLSAIVGTGSVAAVYYANRLIQFPFALVALSIAPVVVVDLSGYHRDGNLSDFKKLLVFSFQNIIFFIIPVSALFISIPDCFIDVLFRRGEFSGAAVIITSSVLFFYALGLFFFCAIKLLVTSFYSLKDTLTPAKTATVSLIVNIILSAILMYPLKIGGVALGTSISAFLNFILLFRILKRRVGKIDWEDTKINFLKVTILSLCIGVLARYLWDTSNLTRYPKFLLVCFLSGGIFIAFGYLLGLRQIHYLARILRKKIKTRP